MEFDTFHWGFIEVTEVVQGWDTPKSNDVNMFKLPIFSISTATN
jgi:hypothetical protein